MKKIIFVLAHLIFVKSSFAGWHSHLAYIHVVVKREVGQCVVEDIWQVGEPEIFFGQCQQAADLKLTRGRFYYPKMSQTYDVNYWVGGWSRSVLKRQHYRVMYTNWCTGAVVSDKYEYRYPSLSQLQFNVENPNLSSEISASYDLAPLTDAEAQLAYGAAEENCKKN